MIGTNKREIHYIDMNDLSKLNWQSKNETFWTFIIR